MRPACSACCPLRSRKSSTPMTDEVHTHNRRRDVDQFLAVESEETSIAPPGVSIADDAEAVGMGKGGYPWVGVNRWDKLPRADRVARGRTRLRRGCGSR